ncbi:dihydroneopterin aldolase [Paracoccus sp. (in: a-proteobacteria)]|uniref:dihydroneopterin aldolase n=1 Tax=Paracoccus sp. TaxID=267 RepID=UPI003A867314
MEQPDRIHLRDHIIAADIGAFLSERGQMQRLRFNLSVDLRDIAASQDDQVDTVLSYDVLVHAIRHALADRRYNLVETLAERIAAEVLAHPRAARIEVSVEKLDRGPGALGITISRNAPRIALDSADRPVRVLLWRAPADIPQGAVIIVPDAPGLPLPQGGDRRRIALLALDQAAWALAGQLDLDVAATRTEIDAAIHAGQQVVWAPAGFAADQAMPADPVALGLWLAGRLAATGLEIALPRNEALPDAPPGSGLPITRAAMAED